MLIDSHVHVWDLDGSPYESDVSLADLRPRRPRRAVRVAGWLPLADAAATERELERLAGFPELVRARHLIHDEPDREWMLRPAVAAGMRVLERAHLSFDAVAERPDLMAQIPRIARRHPSLTVVLDHPGKPPIAANDPVDRAEWERLIRACAAEPGVVAKISVLNTALRPNWAADDWRPYVEVALDAFGPDRQPPISRRQSRSQ